MRWNEFSAIMDNLAQYAEDTGYLGCSDAVATGKDIKKYILDVKESKKRSFFCANHPGQELLNGSCARCVASDLLD